MMAPECQGRDWPQKDKGHIIYCNEGKAKGWIDEDVGEFVNLKAEALHLMVFNSSEIKLETISVYLGHSLLWKTKMEKES